MELILKKEIDNTFYSTRIEEYPIKYSLLDKDSMSIGEYFSKGGESFIYYKGEEYTLNTLTHIIKNSKTFLLLGQEPALEIEIFNNFQVWPLSIIGRIDFNGTSYNISADKVDKVTSDNRELEYHFRIDNAELKSSAQIRITVECYNIFPINMSKIGFQGKISIQNMDLIIPLAVINLIEKSLIEYDFMANRND